MKITLKKHPELKLANELLKIFPEAIIAGGVARDLINGIEFKDVDIFIQSRTEFETAEIAIKIGAFATKSKKDILAVDDSYYMVGILVRVKIENLDICVINPVFNLDLDPVFNAEKLVHTFDMVSSQAWLEPVKDGFEVKATDLFYQLNEKKVLAYFQNGTLGEMYIQRIKEKFPDWLPLCLTQPRGYRDVPGSV